MSKKVTVIGCGVSGLSSAIRLLEEGYYVTIIARDLPPQTTSNAAAAIWYPYRCFPVEKALEWGKYSLEVYYKLAKDPGTGVFPVSFTEYLPEQSPDPWWKSAVRDFRRVNPAEIPSIYRDGYLFEVPFVDTSVYIPWLLSRFKQLGGIIHQKELFSLEEINADLAVNCSGLGARFLANDPEVYPVRGQGIRVKAKNNGGCFLDQQSDLSLCYVFPRTNDIILGGTAQEYHYQTDPDPAITEEILRKVKIMDPSLEIEKVIDTVVGLRPARFEIRLELDKTTPLPVIHNYGHGGAGFTLSWGCAEDVVNLVKSLIKVKSQF